MAHCKTPTPLCVDAVFAARTARLVAARACVEQKAIARRASVRQITCTALSLVFGVACFACAAVADRGDYLAIRACVTSGVAFCLAFVGAVID